MSTSEILKEAWAAVEDADLPEKIHEVAFREAVRLIAPAAGAGIATAAKPPQPSSQAGKPGAAASTKSSGSNGGGFANGDGEKIAEDEATLFERVEAQTGVPASKLEDLVHLDDGVLKVSIPGLKLGKNNAERVRAIAQIFAIVRGFGLDESETAVELVRTEAHRLKCYDMANFSSQLKALSGYLVTGTGANRRIRAKSSGIQSFPALVDRLLGES